MRCKIIRFERRLAMDQTLFADIDSICEDDRKRLSRMLMLSRAESGLSQEKVSLELGIAKKTVQNWEKGVSMPTLPQAIAWFRIMNISAMPYFLQFMFPDIEGISSKNEDSHIKDGLLSLIETLPAEGIRQLMYMFYGNHGSSPRVALNMITAYLQIPLKERYLIDTMILNSYKITKDTGELKRPDNVQPNIDVLDKALEKEQEALRNEKQSYMMVE